MATGIADSGARRVLDARAEAYAETAFRRAPQGGGVNGSGGGAFDGNAGEDFDAEEMERRVLDAARPIIHRLERLADEQVAAKKMIEERWLKDLRAYHGKYENT